jgi:hypothetical protein
MVRAFRKTPQTLLKRCERYSIVVQGSEVMASVIGTLSCANIDVVTDAYQHALFGRFPRARYAVGPDSHLIWLPLSYLPEWIGDFLLGFIDLLIPLPAAMKKPKLS